MKALSPSPNLVEQVQLVLIDEVVSGRLKPGERIIQEQLAAALGVSRQPVQQALLVLRNQGVLQDAPGRGLLVAPLSTDQVRQVYEIRTALEALACRRAAERITPELAEQGRALIQAGRAAAARGEVGALIAADLRFHEFIYAVSGNPLILSTMRSHWHTIQRVMGEVLLRDQQPRDSWDEHEALWLAISQQQPEQAEQHMARHLASACEHLVQRLVALGAP
jgi:DNA-binding GntR family transcriptional regulator